jgi:hypothetical protein
MAPMAFRGRMKGVSHPSRGLSPPAHPAGAALLDSRMAALERMLGRARVKRSAAEVPRGPPPPSPSLVLSGHAASLTLY